METKDVKVKDEGLSTEQLERVANFSRENATQSLETSARALLNGLVELIDVEKDVEHSLEMLNQTLIIIHQKEVFDYYTELSKNIKKEENRAKAMEIIANSHLPKKK